MANYYGTVRTNYFHVKSEEAFRELMSHVTAEDEIHIFEETDLSGKPMFGFGCYGSIYGLISDDDEEAEESYDDFILKLQECIVDDDAAIIMEAGYEKLRYIVGTALVVTSKETYFVDAKDVAIDKARELLGNPEWITKCEY